jgi:hypothetical protein
MRRVILLAVVALTAAVANVASASAAPTDPFQWKTSIEGFGNQFNGVSRMAINQATGNLLILESGVVYQFSPTGEPVNFPATGTNAVTPPFGPDRIYVDNSGGARQGYIYLTNFHGGGQEMFEAFKPNGEGLGTHMPWNESVVPEFVYGASVDPDGNFWIFEGNPDTPQYKAQKMSPEGTTIGSAIALPQAPRGGVDQDVFDEAGNWYAPGQLEPGNKQTYEKFKSPGENFAPVGDTGLPVLLIEPFGALAGQPVVDPSDNNLYVRQREKIKGISTTGPLPATPFELLQLPISRDDGGFGFSADGQTLYVAEPEKTRISVFHREPASAPYGLKPMSVDLIRSYKAEFHTGLNAGGAPTNYRLEYGTTTAYGSSTPNTAAPFSFFPVTITKELVGLQPDTTYHVRLVAENAVGTTYGADRVFKTFGVPGATVEAACPNSLARKQTAALRLPNCRAYELVSAKDTAGYDVESYLAPGQQSFGGFPDAADRVLYSTHSGAIPGPWNATNNGIDPYLATRGPEGWTTNYEGLPSNINSQTLSCASSLGAADPSLSTLAFAGPKLCAPCFAGATPETGIPVRLANGALVQGMAGSLSPAGAGSARPEGKVAQWFSGDGRYLVFASKYAFEPGANSNGTDLTVYERDLAAGTTRIVSVDAAGATLAGAGISELAVSADGSRVLVGKRVSVDSAGNEYVHPYLFIAGRSGSVDLDPGGAAGVLFAGMSEDGSKIYFTTTDKLLPSDEDPSADLYEATADPSGQPTINLVSGGGAASCNPVPNTGRTHWNSVGAAANCDPVAVGGGGGVSASGSTIYFLSPEQFGGQGTANQPNLYRVENAGAPVLVATLEPDNPLVIDSISSAGTRHTGDFQTTKSGNYAVFLSAEPLTGVHTFNHLQAFRTAAAGGLVCASCDYTGTSDESLADDAELAPDGLSVLEDGRVFFTTLQELVLNDANRRTDVYQYSDAGGQELISAGSGPFDSGLLTASRNGVDVFFFTHEALAPEEDKSGSLMKLYDARELGGFFKLPPDIPCKASDECHGPGTVTPGPPVIQSSGKSTPGNFVVCKKNQSKKHGKCVKKKNAKKHKNGKGKKAKGHKQNGKKQGGKKHA